MVFRLASWNIHLGLELERVLAGIRRSEHFRELDVLLLQEASLRGRVHDAEAIASALGPGYRAYQHNVDRLNGRVRGLAVVWNSASFELTSPEMLVLPHLHNALLKRRHRYLLHPLRLHPRSALMVEGRLRGRLTRLYNVHLSPVGFTFQTEQLATILRDAAHRGPCELLALAGDFNSLRVDRRKWAAWFAERERDGFVDASRQVQWTFRSPALPFRQKLDNALVRIVDAASCGCCCPEVPGSDHLPLIVEVAWPEVT
ncbi:MAG TPA: endonuclease/exonuclease/phosphatase family protein [Chloroflexota bacterium]|nr:endonuclease/exonuclease/phosphatase family protein [Chloroflexota bacterium]